MIFEMRYWEPTITFTKRADLERYLFDRFVNHSIHVERYVEEGTPLDLFYATSPDCPRDLLEKSTKDCSKAELEERIRGVFHIATWNPNARKGWAFQSRAIRTDEKADALDNLARARDLIERLADELKRREEQVTGRRKATGLPPIVSGALKAADEFLNELDGHVVKCETCETPLIRIGAISRICPVCVKKGEKN